MIPENEVIPLKKWFAAVLLAALVLTGCGPKQPEAHEAQLFAMDTLMSLRIWGDEALVTQTEDTLRSLEALLSATAEDSDIARLNRDGTAELQPQTADLLQQALDCAARTGGAFDPTVYPLVCLWGFPSGKYHVPTEAELTGALAHTGALHDPLIVGIDHFFQHGVGQDKIRYAGARADQFTVDDFTTGQSNAPSLKFDRGAPKTVRHGKYNDII